MQHNQQLVNLQQTLSEAYDYVTVQLATGGMTPEGQLIPFNPRCAVLNELRDALREATFRHERTGDTHDAPVVVDLAQHHGLVAQGGAA